MAEFDYMSALEPVTSRLPSLGDVVKSVGTGGAAALPKAPEEAKRPQSREEFEALEPGVKFIDPEGQERTKPYAPKSADDFASVPEGATFIDPEGQQRVKPKYEGVDFTAQTLYDMAINDKERQKALERSYPGKVKRDERTNEFYVDDNGKLRRPKGLTGAPVEEALSQAAPVLGSMAGEMVGSRLGAGEGPMAVFGELPLAVGGAGVGGTFGQGFNDIVLQLAGVYDRTGAEEATNLGESYVSGALGSAGGRALSAIAPSVKGYMKNGVSRAVSSFLGADKAGLDQAVSLADKGVQVPPSGWAKGAPHIHNLVEVFDPTFDTSKPLLKSATEHYEKTASGILESMGVKDVGSITEPVAAPSTQRAGEALLAKRLEASQAADAKLEAALNARKGAVTGEKVAGVAVKIGDDIYKAPNHFLALQEAAKARKVDLMDVLGLANEGKAIDGFTTSSGRFVTREEADKIASGAGQKRALGPNERKSSEGLGHNEIAPDVQQAWKDSDKAARGLIGAGFDSIQSDIDTAMKVAKAGSNSGDLWANVGNKLMAVKRGIQQRAKTMYDNADALAGDHRPDISGLPELARGFLEQLPEGFEGKYPAIVKQIRDLGGVVDKNGEVVKPPVEPTFGQLHNLRSILRSNYNYLDLTPDIKEGTFKYFAHRVDDILKQPGEVPELKAAAQALNSADSFYRESMGPLTDKHIQAVMKGLESGMPADPKLLYDTLVKEGRSQLTNKVKDLIGPNLWAGVKAADVQEMLDQSKTLIPGQIDGRTFARQVLSRVRSGMLDAVHGKEASEKLLTQAQNVAMLEGKLDINARPGDTMTDIIGKAKQAAEAAKAAAKQDPLKTLAQDMAKTKSEHAKDLAKSRANDPLGFIYDPKVGAAESVDRILKREDLTLAAAARFKPDSPEFNMLRQVWAQRILQGTMEPGKRLEKFSPEMQQVMFPGATLEQMQTLAKEMDFLMGTRGMQGTARSMMAQSAVEHPWAHIIGGGSPLSKLVLSPVKLIPGGDAPGRAILAKYFEYARKLSTKPGILRWIQKGLNGDDAARQQVRETVQKAMRVGGATGAAASEAEFQAPGPQQAPEMEQAQ